MMLTVMAGFAEMEASLISERTKSALQAAKARGVRLGNPNGAGSTVEAHSPARQRGSLERQDQGSHGPGGSLARYPGKPDLRRAVELCHCGHAQRPGREVSPGRVMVGVLSRADQGEAANCLTREGFLRPGVIEGFIEPPERFPTIRPRCRYMPEMESISRA